MKLDEVNVRNYKLRDNIKTEIEDHIKKEILEIPLPGTIKATLTDHGQNYDITVVAQVDDKIFNSELTASKKKMTGQIRRWQFDSFKKVFSDLLQQIKKSLK